VPGRPGGCDVELDGVSAEVDSDLDGETGGAFGGTVGLARALTGSFEVWY
jgi:hypothetical protein